VLENHLFGGQKDSNQGYESQQVCVGLQTDRVIAVGCVRKPRWVSRLQFGLVTFDHISN